MRAVAIRSNTLDAIDLALAYSLHYNNSQTFWLGDAVCTSHWNTEWPFPLLLRNIDPTDGVYLVQLTLMELTT